MRLRVNERFVSIQGEGLLVGTPSTFVRLTGCNLRCAWCDSPQTSWAPQGEWVAVDTLVRACSDGPRHVVLTGGEPLLQPATAGLSQRLASAGHHVTIETAGTLWRDGVHCDLLSMSPKLANATPHGRDPTRAARHEAQRWQPRVMRRLLDAFAWQLKFVVRAAEPEALAHDLAEVRRALTEMGVSPAQHGQVLLMPECTDPARLWQDYAALVVACTHHGFVLGQRLHIAIFGHTPGT